MKLDFYAPKKLYGTHVLALVGWLYTFIFWVIMPPSKDTCGTGAADIIGFILFPVVLIFLNLVFATYVADWLFKSKIKNSFILNNIFYDIFLDIGISLFFIPIIWIMAVCDQSPKYFLIIFVLFITIRLLKLLQKKSEKRDINET